MEAVSRDELRECVRVRLAQEIEFSLKYIGYVEQKGDLPTDNIVKDLEKAIHDKFSTKSLLSDENYKTFARKVYGTSLKLSPGLFPDEWLVKRLKQGSLSTKDLIEKELEKALSEKPPDICRKMFVGTFLKTGKVDRKKAADLAKKVERACFNHIIRESKMLDTPCDRSWDSREFLAIYSARCGAVNSHLDPRGIVAQSYGGKLIDDLLGGKITPEELGSMSASKMCPDATKKERVEIESRSTQEIVEKYSEIYLCPHCGVRKCKYRRQQSRALDEPVTIKCWCLNCRKPFTRAG